MRIKIPGSSIDFMGSCKFIEASSPSVPIPSIPFYEAVLLVQEELRVLKHCSGARFSFPTRNSTGNWAFVKAVPSRGTGLQLTRGFP